MINDNLNKISNTLSCISTSQLVVPAQQYLLNESNLRFISPLNSYADVTKKSNFLNNNINNSKKNLQTEYNNYRSKDLCVIIPHIKDSKAINFDYVRSTISNKISNVKLIHSKLAYNNNLYIYCYDAESMQKIISSNLLFFNSQYNPQSFTKFVDEAKSFKLFVPKISKVIDKNTIDNELSIYLKSKFHDIENVNFSLKAIRLKKENNPLNSVMLLIKDEKVYSFLLKNGFSICHLFYMPQQFINKPFVRFCTNCLNYGHTSKYCNSKNKLCIKCCDNHLDDQCTSLITKCILNIKVY
jgi:hypothetical protein